MPTTADLTINSQAREVPIHVIDFEGSPRTGILEYGAVTLLNNQIIKTHTNLCAPLGEIPSIETSQHGIEQDDLHNKQPFAQYWDLFSSLRNTGILCAHSAGVEDRFLKSTWPFCAKSPSFSKDLAPVVTWGPWIDTCVLASVFFEGQSSNSLSSLINELSLTEELQPLAEKYCQKNRSKWHCALYDSLGSALILQSIMQSQDLSLGELVLYSQTAQKKRDSEQGFLF